MAVTAATISRSRRASPDLGHEATVDLQDVDLQALQMRERRVAGSEVVEGDAHSEP